MCNCEETNHPGYQCRSSSCHCHDSEDAAREKQEKQLYLEYLAKEQSRSLTAVDKNQYYVSISLDKASQTDVDQIVNAITEIHGSRAGLSVFYDVPVRD